MKNLLQLLPKTNTILYPDILSVVWYNLVAIFSIQPYSIGLAFAGF